MKDAAVTEPQAVPIFVLGILGVVNEQVRAFRELVTRCPGFIGSKRPSPKRWFVVRQVGYSCLSGLDAVANRRVRMNDQLCVDREFPNIHQLGGELIGKKTRR